MDKCSFRSGLCHSTFQAVGDKPLMKDAWEPNLASGKDTSGSGNNSASEDKTPGGTNEHRLRSETLPGDHCSAFPGGFGPSQSLTHIYGISENVLTRVDTSSHIHTNINTHSSKGCHSNLIQLLLSQALSLVSAEGRCQLTQYPA